MGEGGFGFAVVVVGWEGGDCFGEGGGDEGVCAGLGGIVVGLWDGGDVPG